MLRTQPLFGLQIVRGIDCRIRRDLLVTVYRGLNKYKCSVYWLLILRDQPVVGSLGLRYLVAASGHDYLALIR
jgi:hypothetical protein